MGIIKWLIRLIVIFIIVTGIIIFFFQRQIIKLGISYAVEKNTNARINIGKIESKIHKGYVKLSNITILNPKNFKDPHLAEINSITIELDLPKLIKREIAFKKLYLDIKRLYIVRQEGGINITEVRKPSRRNVSGLKHKEKKMPIEDLRIKIFQVVYKNYQVQPPIIERFNLRFEQRYSNVTDFKKIINSIMVQSVLKATFSNLATDINQENSFAPLLDKILDIFK